MGFMGNWMRDNRYMKPEDERIAIGDHFADRKELVSRLEHLYVKLEEIKDPVSFSEDWFKACKYSEQIKNIRILLQILD